MAEKGGETSGLAGAAIIAASKLHPIASCPRLAFTSEAGSTSYSPSG